GPRRGAGTVPWRGAATTRAGAGRPRSPRPPRAGGTARRRRPFRRSPSLRSRVRACSSRAHRAAGDTWTRPDAAGAPAVATGAPTRPEGGRYREPPPEPLACSWTVSAEERALSPTFWAASVEVCLT